jgi:sodium/potassium-transporting ATPase subunit beta
MAVFLKTLDPEAPTQQHKYSMLKDNPGMGKWPMAFAADSTLIYFATTNSSTYDSYITSLSKVLNEYDKKSPGAPLKNCDAGTDKVNFSAACAFNISILGSSCTEKNNFGYSSGKPCVLLRINKIYDWQPASLLFNGKNITTNGTKEWEFSRIASNLKSEYIENDTNNYIPVSCQGENDGDIDNIKNITFYPKYGFSASYFPYENQVNYMPPAVMAEFDIEPGRAVMIWCKIWVANIKHDRGDLQGSVHFEMYITNKY